MMNPTRISLLLAAAALPLAGCGGGEEAGEQRANQSATAGSASASGGNAEAKPAASTIMETLSKRTDLSTLVSAVRAAGLAETLQGAGPYTVFAPTNAAFQKLPAGAAEAMMKPEAKAQLAGALTYHVVPGVVTAKDLASAMERGGGKTELATIDGARLSFAQTNGALTVTDGKGNQARVVQSDLIQSNGVVHTVDTVLMPK